MSLLLKFRYRFESAHRFTSSAAPACQTPHGHTWYATAIFEMTADKLDKKSSMASEFGATKKAWKEFITETVDHSFMHHVDDPLVATMKEMIPGVRLLPFPSDPTTEMIAGLFALKLRTMHRASGISSVEPIAVHIQETPTNSIRFRFEKNGGVPAWLKNISSSKSAWWNSPEPQSRRA